MKPRPRTTPPSCTHRPNLRELVALLREDRAANHGVGSPGFQALLAVRVGQFALTIRRAWLRKPVTMAYLLLRRRVRHRFGIEIANTMQMGRRVQFVHQGAIVLHEYAVIGDDCTIRQAVTLGATGQEWARDNRPTVGRNVSFGAGAVVVGPVHIGDNARIGPNAVVMSDVPEDAIVVAPQSRVIARSDDAARQPTPAG